MEFGLLSDRSTKYVRAGHRTAKRAEWSGDLHGRDLHFRESTVIRWMQRGSSCRNKLHSISLHRIRDGNANGSCLPFQRKIWFCAKVTGVGPGIFWNDVYHLGCHFGRRDRSFQIRYRSAIFWFTSCRAVCGCSPITPAAIVLVIVAILPGSLPDDRN